MILISKKGKFPYEWFDNYDKLNYLVQDLKHSDFYSSLKNKNIKLSCYNSLMKYCKSNNIIYIYELLKWYNNLDVEPMLQACLEQKEFFYTFNLDMYKDAYSLPSLFENIMCQFSLIDFEQTLSDIIPPTNENIPKIYPTSRINYYKTQDLNVRRKIDNYITADEIIKLLEYYNYRCIYCHIGLNYRSWTLDRITNKINHIYSNCVIACLSCNVSRKDMSFKEFYRLKSLE